MIRILLNFKTLALLFICCGMGWSCNGCSGGEQSSGNDPALHSSQRIFYVAHRRGDSFLVSSLSTTIVGNKVMWYEATMESRGYLLDEYEADSLAISFKFTKIFWDHSLAQARLWADGDRKEGEILDGAIQEGAIQEITPPERHTISRYNRYLWYWQTAPEAFDAGGYFLIDSVDVVSSGYMTGEYFFDITKNYRQVDDMSRTFYGIGRQNRIDTTDRVRIDGKKVAWKSSCWATEPDSTRIYDLKEVLVRNTDDVVRLFVEDQENAIFFVYRSDDNPLLWEDGNNVDMYYIDSVDVAKSGLKIE